MRLLKTCIMGVYFAGCSSLADHSPKEPVKNSSIDLLKEKFNLFVDESQTITKNYQGWFNDECDSLLFTALVAHVDFITADVMLAFDGEMWHRRPSFMPECYPEHSKSTISKDMFIGLLWWCWRTHQVEVLEQILDYSYKNNWIMGKGPVSRTMISSQILSTIELMLDVFNDTKKVKVSIPIELLKNDSGYQAHLAVLHSLLRAEIVGHAEGYYIDYYKFHVKRQPQNTLFQYAYHKYTDGDYSKPIAQLLSETYFTNDGETTNKQRCTEWLWQRDFGDNWKPCKKKQVFAGYDFIFIADLILSEF